MADYSKTTMVDQVTDQNGNVIQAGTPLSATNMNRMESGIDLADNVLVLWLLKHFKR
jgi:gluconate kinase